MTTEHEKLLKLRKNTEMLNYHSESTKMNFLLMFPTGIWNGIPTRNSLKIVILLYIEWRYLKRNTDLISILS